MFKVIVERPRCASRMGTYARNRLADEDDLPTKISVKRHVALARRRDKSTIWMRSRCAAGSFHRSAVFSCRICFLVHLTIHPPNQKVKSESYRTVECEPEKTPNSSIQSAMEAVLERKQFRNRVKSMYV